jgi:3-deoxy-D-manno-octulosonic-acid transferase
MVRDEQDAYRLEKLGVSQDKISVTGDCKIDAMLERKGQCGALQAFSHTRPIFIAGSTHPGEEEQVIEAFKILRGRVPGIKLIIVPRHPERASAVAALTSQAGRTLYLSEFENYEFLSDNSDWEFLIVDKIGELFCLYSIAQCAFIGGSLVPKGGQNIMEPALFGIPLCHGVYMSDFHHVSDQFKTLGISKVVETAKEIADFWQESLDENFKTKTQLQSETWFKELGGAAAKNWNIVKKYI